MRKFIVVGLVLGTAALAAPTAAPAADSKALSLTTKLASKSCNSYADCTSWRASCRGPNSKGKWKCKVENYFADGSTCVLGLTFHLDYGKKLVEGSAAAALHAQVGTAVSLRLGDAP